MNTNKLSAPPPASSARRSASDPRAIAPRRPMNWLRFWIQMGIAMVVFNIIAAFITAYFIWPHLHPAG